MSTVIASEVLAARVAQFKQTQQGVAPTARVYVPEVLPIIVKPMAASWEAVEYKLKQVINLPGLWITVRELYDQGYGAELETAAEIALATAKKSPYHLFATMTSKKAGKWATVTLAMVRATWQVRRNALQVIERLKLPAGSVKAILALSWRLKGSILRYLGLATEQGTGIRNPIGLFFALTKRQPRTV
jgi:hypothetical protein